MLVDIDFIYDKHLGITTCHIVLQGTGASRKNDVDQWNEFEGARFAFDRAVREFPREIRKFLWNSFWERYPKPVSHRLKAA